ncbi:MAG TPA: FtsX-like permease family protein, partial [Vicinamibacterales bacterium]|nr:FtsX-like permease family protein [Vicinamibacterales bacterium]
VAPDSYLNNRASTGLSALARVRGDRSVDEARAEIVSISQRLAQAYPNLSGQRSADVRVLAETVAAPVRPTLMLLSGIVLAVFLIAATNIADLLLSDAASRSREFAIRAAIGGATARLARQVVVESLALAAAGGIAGALLVPWLIQALIELYPAPLPRLAEIGVHARAYGIALAATLICGLLVSVPLIRAAGRRHLSSVLRDGDRGSSRRGRRLTSTLVVIEVALSVALLAAGMALARAFATSASSDIGFSPDHTLTFNIAPSSAKYPDSAAIAGFYATLLPALRQLPGVAAVGTTQFLPFTPGQWGDNFVRVGTSDRAPNLPMTTVQMISPGLPEALGLRVVSGRAFSTVDALAAPRVAMVNETLARQHFDNAPLGREVIFQKITWRIVGVLSDKRHTGVLDPPRPELYVPWEQFGRYSGWVVMRTNLPPLSVLPAAKQVLTAIDPTVAMLRPGTMADRVATAIAPQRFRATLTAALGATALILAALGLYGVMAHAVSRRRHEIGLRLALGDTPSRVRRQVVRSSIALAAAGIGIGVMIAVWTAPWLQTFLTDGATSRDAGTLLLCSAILFAVAVVAAWIPARRAARLDPAQVLRSIG